MVEASLVNLAELVVLVVGIVVALQQLDDIKKTKELELETRQANFLTNQTQIFMGPEFYKAWINVVWEQRFATHEEWAEKYSWRTNPEEYINFIRICQYFNHIGLLIKEKMIPEKILSETLTPVMVFYPWRRAEPIAKRWRTIYQDESLLEGFEYMVNRMRQSHPNIYDNVSVPTE